MADFESGFEFLRINQRSEKPREVGLTEIRGPYYTMIGRRLLQDVIDLIGHAVDSFKFSGGAFSIMPRDTVRELIDLCHDNGILVSTGGFIESIIPQGADAVRQYIDTCKDIGFDIIELSCGFITIPTDDWLRLIDAVQKAGLKAKPEVGIQFGAGGATDPETLEQQGQRDLGWVIQQTRRFLDAGAYLIMIESEGITEEVTTWRTDVPSTLATELGIEKLMFEASDPAVFAWYIRHFGVDVNLFVDHSQIVQLECLRRGIWGTAETWGRILTYRG